jgi:hypothetical protein
MKGSSFWDVTVPSALSTYAILVFALLWAGFAIALTVDREWLDLLWNWVQALPAVAFLNIRKEVWHATNRGNNQDLPGILREFDRG